MANHTPRPLTGLAGGGAADREAGEVSAVLIRFRWFLMDMSCPLPISPRYRTPIFEGVVLQGILSIMA